MFSKCRAVITLLRTNTKNDYIILIHTLQVSAVARTVFFNYEK